MNKQKNSKQNQSEDIPPIIKDRLKIEKRQACLVISGTVLSIIVMIFDWRFGLGIAAFVLWSYFWYENGRMDNVTDEYEHYAGGYPKDGLRRMFYSWIWFAVITGIVIYALS